MPLTPPSGIAGSVTGLPVATSMTLSAVAAVLVDGGDSIAALFRERRPSTMSQLAFSTSSCLPSASE